MSELIKGQKSKRKNIYNTRIEPNLELIHSLRSKDFTHEAIIGMLGIASSTYYKYKAEIDAFSETIKKANDDLVEKVEATMYDLAMGKVKTTKEEYKFIDGEEVLVKRTIDQLSPDKVAQFFILTNRAGDKWKHKQEISNDFNLEITPSFNEVLKEQWDKNE